MSTEKPKAETIMDIVNEKVSIASEIRSNIGEIPEPMRENMLKAAETLERDAARLQAARNAEFLCVNEHTEPENVPHNGKAARGRYRAGAEHYINGLVAIAAITESHSKELNELGTVYRTAKAFLNGGAE